MDGEFPSRQRPNEDRAAWTIQSLLAWTTGFFRQHGIPSDRLDAEVLLSHALGKDRLFLYLNHRMEVQEPCLSDFRRSVQRRIRREPVAYITGVREFFSIPLAVSPAVLIPRPETEHLVERALAWARARAASGRADPLRILDLGTGSGNIGIALARHLPEARVLSTDLSFPALALARANARNAGIGCDRMSFLQGDLFGPIHAGRGRFHLIVSNPPYVPERARSTLAPEVASFEPWTALNGGPEGTDILIRILRQAPGYLEKGGALVLEIGDEQSGSVSRSAEQAAAYRDVRIYPDFSGKPRVVVACTQEPDLGRAPATVAD
ncbi:MAG: peptide chain release factor N(5)-glutamine methyltransferase [bacterium]